MSWIDRFAAFFSPSWAASRARSRLALRHYEAAQPGRRTSAWHKSSTDVNAAAQPALTSLRELSRDLRRNNDWVKRGINVLANNTVGWGIVPKPGAGRSRARSAAAIEAWNDWAASTECDFDGRLNFYGLQRLVMTTIAESGEALVVLQPPAPGWSAIPMRVQVLEPDHLDASKQGATTAGGRIIAGVEFDARNARVAYWLYPDHPGSRSSLARMASVRVPADRVIHVYEVERPGQVRGIPWLASAISKIKDLDEYEDAILVGQKIAACLSAFVTDIDGGGPAIGQQDADDAKLEHLEPGQITYLPPGKNVTFSAPPAVQDGPFSARALRRIAASLGITYEELTGDYSQVNFSSSRMARLAAWQSIHVWREHMMIPQLCEGVWRWAMGLVTLERAWPEIPRATWAGPPMPMLDPAAEGLAYSRLARNGVMTIGQILQEQGYDPMQQLDEIQNYNAELDRRGIVLDLDPRKTSGAGQQQAAAASATAPPDAAANTA